ncbi:MAG: undecaprenyldiphospho-muramoylpentapeptide beta-N-acetylglucosaminyltransferase [bacterium]|nr:undecaprenyldiphospho-muramoylpentapeptide beta-N-acetylglucosaminyltransferase [bacterium]
MVSSEKHTLPILITGGGTGGHLYPALAVAEAIQEGLPSAPLLYVGLEKERDRKEVERRGIPFHGLPLMGLQRKLTLKNFKAMALFIKGTARCVRILRGYPKGVVFGVGGYVSAPAMLAGRLLGWKLALHEQNTVPGLVNRWLASQCDLVFTTYEITQEYLKKVPCIQTGFPLRREIISACKKTQRSQNQIPTILVLGGSQGARVVTQTAIEAFQLLHKEGVVFKALLQTGEKNYTWAQSLTPPECVTLVPFIEAMAEAYAQCDLVISRAGSGTLSEIALWGLPSILIPYPFSSENHQKVNSEVFKNKNAAIMFEEKGLTSDQLKLELLQLLINIPTRVEMGHRARTLANEKAADTIQIKIHHLLEPLSSSMAQPQENRGG